MDGQARRGTREDKGAREIAVLLSDLIDRVERLERASHLTNASIEDTSLTIYDDLDRVRGIVGILPDGTSGVVEVNGPVPGKPTPPLVTTRAGQAIVLWHTASRINYAIDPSFEEGVAGWTGNNGAVVALVGGHAQRGSYSMGVRWEGGTVTRSLAGLGLTPGEFYTVAITADTTGGPAVEMRVSGDPDVASTTTGSRLAVTFRAGDTAPVVTLSPVGTLEAGAQTWFDLWSVTPGTDASAYFDGDDAGYTWVGARFLSPSVATEALPSDVRHVQVHADTDPAFTPTPDTFRGAILPGGGPLYVPLPVGIPYYFKVVIVTTSGQYSPPSDPTPVRVRPVESVDLGVGAVGRENIGTGAIEEAHLGFTFDVGSIKVTYGTEPHPEPRVGDMWWDAVHGYQPHRWDGDSWEPIEFGTDALAAGAVTTRNLMAGAVTAGAIAAGAVSTEKLSVGAVAAGASRVLNHQFEVLDTAGGFYDWTLHRDVGGATDAGFATVQYPAIKGDRSAWITMATDTAVVRLAGNKPIPVRGGERWTVSVVARGSRAVALPDAVTIIAQTSDSAESIGDVNIVGTVWEEVASAPLAVTDTVVAGQFWIPTEAKFLTIALRAGPGDGLGAWSVGFDDVVLQPTVGGVQIANGAVRAEHVSAEAIGAEHIEAGTVSGEILAGQVVLASSTIMTRDVDEVGTPIAFSALTGGGYEGKDATRRTRHRLSNTTTPSFYDGDAVLRTADMQGPATFNGPVELARGQTFRLAARVEAPGQPPDLSYEYGKTRLNTTIYRGGGAPVYGTSTYIFPRPFDPLTARVATTRAHDGRFVAVTVHSDVSRVWTFGTGGAHHSWADWEDWRITGYAYDGSHEIVVGYLRTRRKWYLWESYYGRLVEITDPGDTDPTIAVDYADTVPGGATLATGRKFYLIRRRATAWQVRQWRIEETSPGVSGFVSTSSIVNVPAPFTRPCAGAAVGTFDYGDGIKRIVLAEKNTNASLVPYNATTGEAMALGAETWPAAVEMRRGFAWDPVGGYFYDLADDGTLYRYTGNKWTTGGGTWWLGASYYNPAGPYETPMGTRRKIDMRKRADLRVSTPPIVTSDPPSAQDATRWRLYGRKTTAAAAEPAANLFDLVGEGIASSVLLGALPTGGVEPRAANTFPEGGPSDIAGGTWADGTDRLLMQGDGWQNILPPGMIVIWGSGFGLIPKGFLRCDGALVSRTGDTARVFAAYGTRFGAGDGVTTFALPNIPSFGDPLVHYVVRL